MAVWISALRPGEVPEFLDLVRLGFKGELSQRGTDFQSLERLMRFLLWARGVPLWLLTRLTGSEALVLTAKSGERVIGCIAILGRDEPFVIGASVLPEFREQGVALSLLEEAIGRLRSRGFRRVRAAAINEAGRRLAEKAGFVAHSHRILYALSLPRDIAPPTGITVRRARLADRSAGMRKDRQFLWDDPHRPQEAPVARQLLGVHVRSITVLDGQRPVLRCTLSALKAQAIGEIRPQLAAGTERAFLGCLAEGSRWLSELGKREAYLYLPPTEAGLVDVALHAGFLKRHSWVQMSIDL